MAKIIKAPEPLEWDHHKPSLFLGGVIDQGKAEKWGEYVSGQLADLDITIFNPCREYWNPNLDQSPENAEFREQVQWELFAQSRATCIIYVFGSNDEQASKSRAPITLLELGLFGSRHLEDKTVLVCCPRTYWRHGNVKITCEFLRIPVFYELNEMLKLLKPLLIQQGRKI